MRAVSLNEKRFFLLVFRRVLEGRPPGADAAGARVFRHREFSCPFDTLSEARFLFYGFYHPLFALL